MEIKCECEGHEFYQNRGYINLGFVFIETKPYNSNSIYYCYCKGCLNAEPLDDSYERFISEKEYIAYKLLE